VVEPLEDRVVPDGRPLPLPFVFAGAGTGKPPTVVGYHADTGAVAFERAAFEPGFAGGVRVAAGDVSGDGIPDLVAAAGPGGGPRVRVFDGKTGDQIAGPLGSFYAYAKGFKGGLHVAAGDVNGDGRADVITAADKGGGPHVKVFSGSDGTVLASFYAFDPAFTGGATVAAADFTGDRRVEVAVGAGPGGPPRVKVFDPMTGGVIAGPLGEFLAFEPGFKGGVNVGTDALAGDVTGDGTPDLVVGAGAGGGPRVRVFDGATGAGVRDFFAFDEKVTAGVRVATAFVTDDPHADVVVGTGPGPTARVKVFDGLSTAELAAPMSPYTPFGKAFAGGVYVAASNDPPVVTSGGGGYLYEDPSIGGSETFLIYAGSPVEEPVTFNYRLAGDAINGRDYVSTPGTVTAGLGTITMNVGEDSVYVTVYPLDDKWLEGDEDITFTLLPGAGYSIGSGGAGPWTITIVDDDDDETDFTSPPDPHGGMDVSRGCDCGCGAPASEPVEMTKTLTRDLPIDTKSPVDKATGGHRNAMMTPGDDKDAQVQDLLSRDSDPPGRSIPVAGQATGGAPSGWSGHPVRYADGLLQYVAADLWSDGLGGPLGVSRMWSNNANYSAGGLFGPGWSDGFQPFALATADETVVAVVLNGSTAIYFDETTPGQYVARHFGQETLTDTGTGFTLKTPTGGQVTFGAATTLTDGRGMHRFASSTDGDGVTTSVVSTSGGRPTEVQRAATVGGVTHTASLVFAYGTTGGATDRVTSATLRRKVGSGAWETARSAEYTYYNTGAANGRAGDLRTATMKDASGTALETEYYRYYTASGGLKYAVRGESLRRATAAHGTTLDSISDTNLAPFSDHYFEYDSQLRVTKEVAGGAGCSACSGGLGEFTFAYTTSTAVPENVNEYARFWKVKTVETLPDGSTNTVYTNARGATLLKVFHDAATSTDAATFHAYDEEGRRVLTASQSAITGWSDSYPDLLNRVAGDYQYLSDTQGLVERVDWYYTTTATTSTAGAAAGYLQGTSLQRGEYGVPVPQSKVTYIARTAGGVTGYQPAAETAYRNADGTGGVTTTYAFTWDTGTHAIRSAAVTNAVVSTGQNGSGSATGATVVLDSLGQPAWAKDAGGFLTYTAYDPATGAVVKVIEDVNTANTGDFTGLPSGWSTPSGGGLHRITTVEVDALGRPTKVTSPGGVVDYTVYNDAAREVRHYPGWDSTSNAPTGPTVVSRADATGTYSEVLTMTATPAVSGGRPTGTESVSGLKSLSRTFYNDAGQAVAQHDYFDLTGLTYTTSASLGTQGTHYYRTEQRIGKQGLPNRTLSPAGTIARTEYDGQGRPVSEWVGTDDTPTTGFWSPSNTAGTDLVKVAAYEYDGGGAGDGNLTKVTLIPGGGAADRVTRISYDWRDRPVAVKEGVETTESTAVNRPITYLVYDNLNRVTTDLVFDGDGVTVADANSDGVPDQPSAGLLRAKSVTSFDDLGRAYQLDRYGVNQSTGSVATTPLTAKAWRGPRGEVVKALAPGGLVEKAAYDGLGQPTFLYTTDGGGDSAYADALTVTGDTVFAQVEPAFDADGRVIKVTSRERRYGETGTGGLGTATTGVRARLAHVGYYYDGGGRLVAELDVGTNGGVNWSRPGSVPTPSGFNHVTSYAYGTDGLPYEVVAPDGVAYRAEFDALGRPTNETAAYGTADAFTTSYAYDSGGRLSTVTLPGSRVTKYAYDTFERVSGVTERYGTALARTSEVVYNRLGETVGTTDPLGTDAAVAYDVLGRITTVTAAVGLAVERSASWTYDALGRAVSATDTRGYVTAFAYDDVNRTATATDPLGYTTTAAYDADGRVVSLTDAYGKAWTTDYDLQGRVVEAADPLGSTTKYRYWVAGEEMVVVDPRGNTSSTLLDRFGNVGAVFDRAGNMNEFSYDPAGRLVQAFDGHATETDYDYDALGRLVGVTEAAGYAEERTTSFDFNASGDLVSATNPRGVVTTYGHDTAGRVTSVTLADGTADELLYETDYDLLDRVAATTRPGGRVTEYGYDELGQVTAVTEGVGTALERTTAFDYDDAGNLVTVTDPLSHATTYGYSKRNERTTITDALSGVTTLAYDKVGNLVSLTDPVGNETTWAYDDARRMVEETDPLGKATGYAYDENGNVVEVEDRLGRKRLFTYDGNNRKLTEVWKSAAGSTVQTQTFTYDANGNLLTATDPDGSYTLTYDALNRVATVAQPFGVSQTFTYDANGNRLTASDSAGGVLTSTYDNLDRLATRELGGTGVTPMKAAWGYDSDGDMATVTRSGKSGGSWVTAGVTTYTHDDLGRVTNIRLADASNATLSQYGYTFDDADRITAMTVNGTSRTFGYDNTNQLTGDNGTTIAYDKNGNRTGTGYTTHDANRMTADGTWAYTYNDEGQLVGKSKSGVSWSYEYDHRGQMTKATSGTTVVEYDYDAFGNRIERSATVGGTTTTERFVVDGWDTAKPGAVGTENFDAAIDLNGSNAVTARRVFGAGFDDLVGMQSGSGAVSWYGTDHLGSVRQVFDNSGTVTNTVDYDAFGGFLGGVPADRYAYTGREYDAVTGQTHYRARVKDGHRFTTEDPLRFATGDTNLARYVGNASHTRRDPSGLDSLIIENNQVSFERTYYITPWANGGVYAIGSLVEIEGRQYVQHGSYLVPLEQVRDAIERTFTIGYGGEWRSDPNAMTEWFRQHDVGGEVRKPHDQRAVADRMFGPAATLGGDASRAVNQMITDVAESALQDLAVKTGVVGTALLLGWAVKKGYKVIRNSNGKITHLVDESGNRLSPEKYRELQSKFAECANSTRVKGRLVQPRGCFPAGTLVTTEDGLKPIQTLRSSDRVWGYDLTSGVWKLRRVVETYEHDYEGDIISLVVEGEVIEATTNHPCWVVEGAGLEQRKQSDHVPVTPAGSRLRGRWIDAGNLLVGDVLFLKSGRHAIVSHLSVRQARQKVYNFQVEEVHTYAVGRSQVLVHNKPMEYAPRPNGPVGKMTKPNDKWFFDRGLDPHQIKDDIAGGSISRYDVFKDRDNNLWVLPKNGNGEPQWYGRWVDE
jgi:RHS repeat-associated protein